jgi:hypothetical protein
VFCQRGRFLPPRHTQDGRPGGTPWTDAQIRVEPGGFSAVTDTNGYFDLDARFPRSQLPFRVETSIDGFAPATAIISETNAAKRMFLYPAFSDGAPLFLNNLPSGRIRFLPGGADGPDKEMHLVLNNAHAEVYGLVRDHGPCILMYYWEPQMWMGIRSGDTFAVRMWAGVDGMSGVYQWSPRPGAVRSGRFWVERSELYSPPLYPSVLNFSFFPSDGGQISLALDHSTKQFRLIGSSEPRDGKFSYGPLSAPPHGNIFVVEFSDEPAGDYYRFTLAFHGPSGSTNRSDFYLDRVAAGTQKHTAGFFTYIE